MKVSEIKAVVPHAECYELRPDARYIIVVPPTTRPEAILNIIELGQNTGIRGAVLAADGVSFYELGE